VYPDKWQSFFPHDSFKTILTSVIEMLEKGSETKDRSLWVNGAYGTGKTYASFTIKPELFTAIYVSTKKWVNGCHFQISN
jgi:hypothetical protein